jgi:hypothetical protein
LAAMRRTSSQIPPVLFSFPSLFVDSVQPHPGNPGRREAALGHDPLVEIEDEGAYVSSRVEGAQRGLIGRVMMEYALVR